MTDKSNERPRRPEPPTMTEISNCKDYTSLEWLAQQGAKFCQVAAWNATQSTAPGKQPLGKGWQNNHLTFEDILPHIKRGGNVGLLCGPASGNLGILDIDASYQEFCKFAPDLATAPAIIRDNADRAKVILRIDGDMPDGRKFLKKPTPESRHTEWLSKGNQGVVPPSIHPTGKPYQLINTDTLIPVLTPTKLIDLVELWTATPWLERPQAQPTPPTIPQDGHGKLSKATIEFIQQGATAGARNHSLYRAACDLSGCGYSQAEAEAMLLQAATKSGTPEAEAISSIKSAYSQNRTPARPDAFTQEPKRMTQYTDIAEQVFPPADFEQAEELPDDETAVIQTRYQEIKGYLYSLEHGKHGPFRRLLANFTARILKEILIDDGSGNLIRRMAITGKRADGRALPSVTIDAADFASMFWVMKHWGSVPIIEPGNNIKDRIRAAIQHNSDPAQEVNYVHTGFRDDITEGQQVYLSAGGAIGAAGITVTMQGNFSRYAIPTQWGDVDPKEAVKASLRFLEAGPHTITIPLFACVYLAPLASIHPLDFVPWLYGSTGEHKSTIAALALCHYGPSFTDKTLPGNWISTFTTLETEAYLVKDALYVVDDFAPTKDMTRFAEQSKKAEDLIRLWGNAQAKGRSNADKSLQNIHPARGLVLGTAEQLPGNTESILARLLPIAIHKGDLNREVFSNNQAEQHLYSYAMLGYIEWMQRNWYTICKDYPQKFNSARAKIEAAHKRLPGAYAHVLVGIELALSYCEEVGAIRNPQAKALLAETHSLTNSMIESHTEIMRDEKPPVKAILAIKALVRRGEWYIGEPDKLPTGKNNSKWAGWRADGYCYIVPDIYGDLMQYYARQGSSLGVTSKTALYSQLAEAGYIFTSQTKTGGRDSTPQKRYPGKDNDRYLWFFENKYDDCM
jgi:hypothetical protein